MIDICCVGHITLDKITTPSQSLYMPGGTAYYFTEGIRHLGKLDYQLVTAVGEAGMPVIRQMRENGTAIKLVDSTSSVFFENIYGTNPNHRTQRVRSKATPFTVKDLEGIDARIFHLGSLLADDFAPDLIPYLHTKGMVSLDVQGLLREVRGEEVFPTDWEAKRELLPYVDILKVNEYEMEVLTGYDEPHEAARQLAGWGCPEVCITDGSYGSLIYAQGTFYDIPAFRPTLVTDVTGCGDTYSTGYLYKRIQGAGYEEAGRFAAAMATLKLQAAGPFAQTESDIIRTVEQGDII